MPALTGTGPQPRKDLLGAILAGGEGRRLGGRVKPLLELEGRTILEKTIEVLSEVCQRVVIVAKESSWLDKQSIPVLLDESEIRAPLFGIQAALREGAGNPVLVVAGDMPFLESGLLSSIASHVPPRDAALPRLEGLNQPTCAVYGARCLDLVSRRIEKGFYKIDPLFAEIDTAYLDRRDLGEVDPERVFFNINTEEDYLRAQTLMRR